MALCKSRIKAALLCLFIYSACGNKVVSAKLTESEAVANSEMDIVVLTRLEPLSEHDNRLVKRTSVGVRMKKGSAIEVNDGHFWCSNSDWEDASENMVLTTGVLSKGGSLMSEVPVAKQDEDGNWPQGIAGPPSLEHARPSQPKITTEHVPSNDSESIKPNAPAPVSDSWYLRVNDFEVVEQ